MAERDGRRDKMPEPYGPCAPNSNANQITGEHMPDMQDGYPTVYPIEQHEDGLKYAAGPPALYYDGTTHADAAAIEQYKEQVAAQYKGPDNGSTGYTGSIDPWPLTTANWACYQQHALGNKAGEIFNQDPNPALSVYAGNPGALASTPPDCAPFSEWVE